MMINDDNDGVLHILYIAIQWVHHCEKPMTSVFFHHFQADGGSWSLAEIGDGKATPLEYGKKPPRIMEESGRGWWRYLS
jgi:hypothetical protein